MSASEHNQSSEYLRTRVMTASAEELRLMLLEGAIKFARQGRAGLEASDLERAVEGVSQCRSIVAELLSSIRPEHDPALADRVRSVYTFMYRELMEVGVTRDVPRLDRVIELLEYERETWLMLMGKLRAEREGAPGQTAAAGDPPTQGEPRALSLEA